MLISGVVPHEQVAHTAETHCAARDLSDCANPRTATIT